MMMPLQDVSKNLPQSSSNPRLHRKTVSNAGSAVSSGPVPPPMAVQSMLRTATEVGDVGNLALPSARFFHPGSRLQSTRPRSGSFDSSFASALHHHRSPRDRPSRYHTTLKRRLSDPSLARYSTTQSILAKRPSDHIVRASGSRKYHDQLHGLTSPQHSLHALHSHRSLLTLRSHGRTASGYSGSISSRSIRSDKRRYREMYPTRLPYSPAYSKRVGFVGNHTSASSSPGLEIKHNHFPFHTSQVSRFSSSMTHNSARARPRMNKAMSTRTVSQLSRPDESQPKLTPRYYDYTESFTEEERLSPDKTLPEPMHIRYLDEGVPTSKADTALMRPQTQFGTRLGSKYLPAELPTKHNRRVSESSIVLASSSGENQSRLSARRDCSTEIAELPADIYYELNPTYCHSNNQDQSLASQDDHRVAIGLGESTFATICGSTLPHPVDTVYKSGTLFHNGERSERDFTALATRLHSPAADSGARSIDHNHVNIDMARKSDPASSRSQELSTWGCSTVPLLSSKIRVVAIAEGRHENHSLRTSQSGLEIFSPQPHRPISSQSRKHVEKLIQSSNDTKYFLVDLASDVDQDINCNRLEKTDDRAVRIDTIANSQETEYGNNGTALTNIDRSDDWATPQAGLHLSLANSHGKSTIDSLLEKHIESLGLMPESSGSSKSSASEELAEDMTSESTLQVCATSIWLRSSRWPDPTISELQRSSSPSSTTRLRLKPRKLFASMDGYIFVCPEPFTLVQNLQTMTSGTNHTSMSGGWHTLPSNSYPCSQDFSSKPTITSGEMADIDTEVRPLGHKIERLSQFSLPTSLEHQSSYPMSTDHSDHLCVQNRANLMTRAASYRRRHVKIRLRRKKRLDQSRRASNGEFSARIGSLYSSKRSPRPPCSRYVELDGESAVKGSELITQSQPRPNDVSVPSRWSSIIAAMPMPGTGLPILPRQTSTRTIQSQKSYRNRNNPANPVNSTRQGSHIPWPSGSIPRLAPPDLGPRLDTSTLNLSIPYAEAPSTIYPSLHDNRSFFDDSPARTGVFRRSTKRQFGLRPLKNGVRRQRASSTCVKAGLPMRNSITIAAIGSALAATNQSESYEIPSRVNANEQAASLQGQKRSMVERLKDWWRKQCMLKVITTRKRRTIRRPVGGMVV